MEISRRDVGPVTVLDLSGKLTLTDGSGDLKEAVTGLVVADRRQIVLNLKNLSYMDSAGLGEMVACYSSTAKSGGMVRLAHTTGKIKDLLTITKLLTVFDAYDSEADAVASFAA